MSKISNLVSRGNQDGAVYRAVGDDSLPREISPAERERAEQRRQDLMIKDIMKTVDTTTPLRSPWS